jgi:hypothetical protein
MYQTSRSCPDVHISHVFGGDMSLNVATSTMSYGLLCEERLGAIKSGTRNAPKALRAFTLRVEIHIPEH